MPIALIIHGGAWAIPDDAVAAHQAGCRAALAAGWGMLAAGASALEVCETAVRILEDDPTFDAGTGAHLTADGAVELDAALMDGRTLRYGAVTSLRHIRNPITLARHVLLGPATMLTGEGAERFARVQGMELCANEALIVEREREYWQRQRDELAAQVEVGGQVAAHALADPAEGGDTVGAIALDRAGTLVTANSTGGTPFKLPGRVGDTPLPGCGFYADNLVGACVCTGWGEAIARLALARRAVGKLERGYTPQAAAEYAVRLLAHRVNGGNGGCIVLDANGQVGLAWNTRRMAYAYRVEGDEARWGSEK